jgi:hypothetical protein
MAARATGAATWTGTARTWTGIAGFSLASWTGIGHGIAGLDRHRQRQARFRDRHGATTWTGIPGFSTASWTGIISASWTGIAGAWTGIVGGGRS